MEIMYNNWKRYIFGMWLGFSLTLNFDVTIFDPEFWFVALPTVVFVYLFNDNESRIDK
jgi:hypothetical protein